jgi:hypothetical protein
MKENGQKAASTRARAREREGELEGETCKHELAKIQSRSTMKVNKTLRTEREQCHLQP